VKRNKDTLVGITILAAIISLAFIVSTHGRGVNHLAIQSSSRYDGYCIESVRSFKLSDSEYKIKYKMNRANDIVLSAALVNESDDDGYRLDAIYNDEIGTITIVYYSGLGIDGGYPSVHAEATYNVLPFTRKLHKLDFSSWVEGEDANHSNHSVEVAREEVEALVSELQGSEAFRGLISIPDDQMLEEWRNNQ
jgi:hypothetical protein